MVNAVMFDSASILHERDKSNVIQSRNVARAYTMMIGAEARSYRDVSDRASFAPLTSLHPKHAMLQHGLIVCFHFGFLR